MEKEGCFTGFVLNLIGGFFWLILGVLIILKVLLKVWDVGAIGDELTRGFVIGWLALALYILIISVWVISAAFWIKKAETLKKGSWTSLILGIISVNVLAIVAGATGLAKLRKMPSTVKLKPVVTPITKPIIKKPFTPIGVTKPLAKTALKQPAVPVTKEKVPSKPVMKPVTKEISTKPVVKPIKPAVVPLTKPVAKPASISGEIPKRLVKPKTKPKKVRRPARKPVKRARKPVRKPARKARKPVKRSRKPRRPVRKKRK